MKGSMIFETNEILKTDHRSHVIGMNLEEYFRVEFSGCDKIERRFLNPTKRTHRENVMIMWTKFLTIFH